jgi:hypothetical protein
MNQGRLRFANGFSVNCLYEFRTPCDGRFSLYPAVAEALAVGDIATLVLRDEMERRIKIVQLLELDGAAFRVIDA